MAKAELYGKSPIHPLQRLIIRSLDLLLRAYNRLEVSINADDLPKEGNYIALINHSSIFDTLAMMVADPYRPPTSPILKESFSRIPVIKDILDLWNPIYVNRDGSDVFATRHRIKQILFEEERGVCVAAEGTRSISGRMESLHPALVRIVLECASNGVPIIPCGVDAYSVLPKGSKIALPRKITVNIGAPMDLSPWTGRSIGREDLIVAGKYMQDAIANLLPPQRRPLPSTPPLKLRETR